ncbi:MAG: thermonuclease family protein [Rhodothermales bacterium]
MTAIEYSSTKMTCCRNATSTFIATLTLLALITISNSYALAEITVVDGDTLNKGNVTYRLEGIDAPEYGQKCNKKNSKNKWQCGKAATKYLSEFILGKNIRCTELDLDDFGRVIATCYADEIEINRHMVEQGLAWAFRKFSNTYVEEENKASSMGIGVFQAITQTPWGYRAAKWSFAAQEAPEGCPIKGNISNNGRIYHAPWSPWYSRTKVSVDKGERWFCSEGEALDAGWRAPYWGK